MVIANFSNALSDILSFILRNERVAVQASEIMLFRCHLVV